uniref:Uncharacterized protein n=1 Tax=Amblyomma maculatum TaxID=34609 RepID=G3MRF8_AMBMU
METNRKVPLCCMMLIMHVNELRVISSYPYSVAISDSDNDGTLECLSANRTAIDPEAKTATMTWIIPENEFSPRQEIPFHLSPGEEPGTMDITVDDDPTPREGIFYYTDDNCVVLDVEYQGHQCLLWTRRALKDSVPQICIDHFVDTCGVSVPKHSRDLCIDGEGDY